MAYALSEPDVVGSSIECCDIERAALRPVPAVDPRYAFAQLPWLRAWHAAYAQQGAWRGPAHVYAVREGNRCIGTLLLATQTLKGLPVKALAGYYWPFRTVCVSANPAERERFADAIAEAFSFRAPSAVLRFGPIAEHDEGVEALLSALRQAGWTTLRKHAGSAFYLRLPESADDLGQMMSASLRKNLHYLRRRLHKEGVHTAYDRYAVPGQGADLLRALQAIESASWVAASGGHPKFLGAAGERFYAALTRLEECEAQPVVWMLRCDGEPVAFSFHIEAGDTTYIVANSYDARWKQYSPGSLLSHEVLQHACAHGMRHIDWGRGDSGYKSRWGAEAASALQELLLFSPHARGRAAYAVAKRALADWRTEDHATTETSAGDER